MFRFLQWMRLSDPTQRAVRKYARAIVKFHEDYPERPLQECIPPLAKKLLLKLMPSGTYEGDRLEAIFAGGPPCYDPVEYCCRLVTLETGVTTDDGREYLQQAEQVEAELRQMGFYERSDWLDGLRATVRANSGAESDARLSSDEICAERDRLAIPRWPKLGNWIGFTLFATIGIVCLLLGYKVAALVLGLLGMLSLITSVSYWEIDGRRKRLLLKSGNGLSGSRQYMSYPADEIVEVHLEIRRDSEGGNGYSVLVEFQQGQQIMVSDHRRDADRIAAYLVVPKRVIEL
jgi:hypothetical protein